MKLCPDCGTKPTPVVAAEGRYGALRDDGWYLGLTDGTGVYRVLGTQEQAVNAVAAVAKTDPGHTANVVRILADGEHEAAVEAARREERERVLASIGPQRAHVLGAADRTNGVEAVRLYGQVDGLDYVRGLLGDERTSRMTDPERLWAFRYTTGRRDPLTGKEEVLFRASDDRAWVDQKNANTRRHKHLTATPVAEYVLASVAWKKEMAAVEWARRETAFANQLKVEREEQRQLANDYAAQVTALRRERDALAAALQVATVPHGVPVAAYEELRARAERDAQRAGRMRCFLNRLAAGEVWNAKLDADYIRGCDDKMLGGEATAKGVG